MGGQGGSRYQKRQTDVPRKCLGSLPQELRSVAAVLSLFPGFPLSPSPLLFFFIGPLTILKSPSSLDHDPGFQLHTSNCELEFLPQHPTGTLRPNSSISPSHPALPCGGCVFHFTRLVLGGPFQPKYSFFFFFPAQETLPVSIPFIIIPIQSLCCVFLKFLLDGCWTSEILLPVSYLSSICSIFLSFCSVSWGISLTFSFT